MTKAVEVAPAAVEVERMRRGDVFDERAATARRPLEVVVPTPIAPTKVDVADVVARIFATVGVEVPITDPAALVERRILLPTPESVSVPVAVIAAAVRLPEKRPLPCTESDCDGEVVPMPTRPPFEISKNVLVDEPMTNAGPGIPLAFTDNNPQGDVEETPMLPLPC